MWSKLKHFFTNPFSLIYFIAGFIILAFIVGIYAMNAR